MIAVDSARKSFVFVTVWALGFMIPFRVLLGFCFGVPPACSRFPLGGPSSFPVLVHVPLGPL